MLSGYSIDRRLNFDGFRVTAITKESCCAGYTQFFRSGIIELVRVYQPRNGETYILSTAYERELIERYARSMSLLKELNVQPPLYVFLTLIEAKGFRLGLGTDRQFWHGEPSPFDRDVLPIPDVALEQLDTDGVKVLKPLFDAVWNAAGYERSLNYTDTGDWQA